MQAADGADEANPRKSAETHLILGAVLGLRDGSVLRLDVDNRVPFFRPEDRSDEMQQLADQGFVSEVRKLEAMTAEQLASPLGTSKERERALLTRATQECNLAWGLLSVPEARTCYDKNGRSGKSEKDARAAAEAELKRINRRSRGEPIIFNTFQW